MALVVPITCGMRPQLLPQLSESCRKGPASHSPSLSPAWSPPVTEHMPPQTHVRAFSFSRASAPATGPPALCTAHVLSCRSLQIPCPPDHTVETARPPPPRHSVPSALLQLLHGSCHDVWLYHLFMCARVYSLSHLQEHSSVGHGFPWSCLLSETQNLSECCLGTQCLLTTW